MVSLPTGRRGQLLIIGSILLAVAIVGLSVVANSVLFTESVARSVSNAQLSDVDEFSVETQDGIRELTHRVNHAERNRTTAELKADLRRNARNYSRLLAESYATSGPVAVNVSAGPDDSEFGHRIVQAADGNLTDDGSPGAEDWDLVATTDRQTLGWFALNVEVFETATDRGRIVVGNGSADVDLRINRTGSGGAANLTLEADPSWSAPTTLECNPSKGRVLLDLAAGEAVARECTGDGTFPGADRLGGDVSIEIENGDRIQGQYDVVVAGDPSPGGYTDCSAAVAPDQPCRTPAVWTANASLSFVGSRAAFGNDYDLEVYGESS